MRAEAKLSEENSKTLDLDRFKTYVTKKLEFNASFAAFYARKIFRKQKFERKSRTVKSEAMMINNFKEKFGGPNETIIAFGDYLEFQHAKFTEPVKGKGFRDLFRRHKYQLYLIDEFRTSVKCNLCSTSIVNEEKKSKKKKVYREYEHGDCEKFRRAHGAKYPKHGLLKCETCKKLWNRDLNGSMNIYKVAKSEIFGAIKGIKKAKRRPEYLKPQKVKKERKVTKTKKNCGVQGKLLSDVKTNEKNSSSQRKSAKVGTSIDARILV